ncbi:MAG: hypothetical protein MSH25_09685 [Desulfovibrio sp.]|uniref:hypothetical protein n=1 Tax=Desulfovibrio sp. TaxID=885 RepID=UPI0025B91EE1|nr:hypothetical protein [Desulfovibrio sp.]MCI7569609.1 hypothetical protein [Desulfovibrio sp.]
MGTIYGRFPGRQPRDGIRYAVRRRKTLPRMARGRCLCNVEQFQFETLRVSNHTACRFAEKTRFFRSLWAGRRCVAASRFTFFKGETLWSNFSLKRCAFPTIRPVVSRKKRGFSARFGPGGAVPPPRIFTFFKAETL